MIILYHIQLMTIQPSDGYYYSPAKRYVGLQVREESPYDQNRQRPADED